MRLLLGGYTADMDGHASGIGMLLVGDADGASAGGPLAYAGEVAAAASPSWLTAHPGTEASLGSGSPSLSRGDVVYAALEGAGAVQAYRRTGEASFVPLGAPVEAGSFVCHIAVDPGGAFLLATCWGDGRVVRMSLDAAGRPSSPTIAPDPVDPHGGTGSPASPAAAAYAFDGGVDLAAAARALREAAGDEYAHLVPDHDRAPTEPAELEPGAADAAASERVPHAHQSLFLPGGLVATTDMGFDIVRLWRASAAGLRHAHDVVLPRGSGPRHMAWHPSGHLYVVAELSCEVFVLAPDVTGTWRVIAGVPLGPTQPGDTAAELALSHDRAFLYAGVRGSDTLAAVRVRGAGDELAPVALVEAGVRWPRHHVVARDALIVAGQLGDEVASLTLDIRTGVPGRARHRTAGPSPTCLLPLR
ncbi:6-phosphogluconolactonase (cycloisomerase 2 family) [Microbacterium terrae]|uniref:6-phosphogluconolactonase n=1 Tax=Microbacterium terrae TaxID=69369 RepID=A0A0M2GX73_9MICO|nr:beta-propeller fold lactonase family protein [Microbacterium terrae]KJL38498.1 6-phosphogluconolactonase [Microbacterium terrae]MBP1078859.1 6-phosphogluconolactonase (cycloisomerase 2 family) [Microbacterium terrae]GLJ98259.1 hypothetical protein GCM10017594_14560 [Microbacterium terrae]